MRKYEWEYFFTTTFRSPRREPYYALKHVQHALQDCNCARGFLGAEPHKSGDLHVHGIVAGRPPGWEPSIALPWVIFDRLEKRFGRSKVEACNSSMAVTSYCSKYILKDQSNCQDHYSIFGNDLAWKGGLTSQDGN